MVADQALDVLTVLVFLTSCPRVDMLTHFLHVESHSNGKKEQWPPQFEVFHHTDLLERFQNVMVSVKSI